MTQEEKYERRRLQITMMKIKRLEYLWNKSQDPKYLLILQKNYGMDLDISMADFGELKTN